MPFAQIKTYENKESNSLKRLEYLNISGPTTIRVLDKKAYDVESHYFAHARASVECLGNDCPICDTNKKVYAMNPEKFRDDVNYHARSTRYFVNVLDRTPTKICTKCSAEVRNLNSPACTSCGELITTVQAKPLNKVKILGKGIQLFEQLNAIEASIFDKEGNPLTLTDYDITLVPSGSGKKTTITPIPDKGSNDVIDVNSLELFDLTKAILKFTREELVDLQRGISVKDIFTARKATKVDLPANTESSLSADAVDARATVDALFASLEE